MASTIIAAAAINLRIVETFRVLEVAKEDCHLSLSVPPSLQHSAISQAAPAEFFSFQHAPQGSVQ